MAGHLLASRVPCSPFLVARFAPHQALATSPSGDTFGSIMLRHPTRHPDTAQSVASTEDKADCSLCDAVCCRLIVILEPGDDIPAHLTTPRPEGTRAMAHHEDGWCVAMDRVHMNCGIYENRPAVCRRFYMGGPYCNAIRSEYDQQHSRRIEITLK